MPCVPGSLKPSNGAGGSSHGQSLASLVDAVVQLGGASEALQSLRKHLATQVAWQRTVFSKASPPSARRSERWFIDLNTFQKTDTTHDSL